MKLDATQRLRARLDGGLVAAVPVPFDAEGRLHATAQESYLRHMAAQPLAGVAVWAHTGRGLVLDEATAKRVLADWRAALPDSVVVAGAGSRRGDPERATSDALEMAR